MFSIVKLITFEIKPGLMVKNPRAVIWGIVIV